MTKNKKSPAVIRGCPEVQEIFALRETIKKKKKRRRPNFPGGHPPSIIGAKELNYCVRDGNRWSLLAIVTANG